MLHNLSSIYMSIGVINMENDLKSLSEFELWKL